jgi:hypothetical protein
MHRHQPDTDFQRPHLRRDRDKWRARGSILQPDKDTNKNWTSSDGIPSDMHHSDRLAAGSGKGDKAYDLLTRPMLG